MRKNFKPMKMSFKNKQELRQKVWAYMEENKLVTFPRPCYGRIPNFIGSRTAVEGLKTLPEWREAQVIFSAPDSSLSITCFCEIIKSE